MGQHSTQGPSLLMAVWTEPRGEEEAAVTVGRKKKDLLRGMCSWTAPCRGPPQNLELIASIVTGFTPLSLTED